MSGPQPLPITIPPAQRAVLERLVRRPTSPQGLVRRAQIILAAADGARNTQIAQHLGCSMLTIRTWRARWAAAAAHLAVVEAAADDRALWETITTLLADAPRPGAPDTFAAEQLVQIIALACTPPADSGRPVEDWTPRDLADEAVKRKIVSAISPRTVGRFLKAGRSQTPSEPLLAEHEGG